jgi:hypothetical protein
MLNVLENKKLNDKVQDYKYIIIICQTLAESIQGLQYHMVYLKVI